MAYGAILVMMAPLVLEGTTTALQGRRSNTPAYSRYPSSLANKAVLKRVNGAPLAMTACQLLGAALLFG